MELISKLIEYLIESQKSLPSLALRIFAFVIFIFILDYATGLSKSVHESYKIQHLREIMELVQTDTSEIIHRSVSSDLLSKVSSRMHYSQRFDPLFSNWEILPKHSISPVLTDSIQSESYSITAKNSAFNFTPKGDPRKFIWMLISSNWLTLLLMILIIPASAQSKQPLWATIISLIAVWSILGLWAYFSTKLLYILPLVFESSLFSYLLNIMISLLLVLSPIALGSYINRKETESKST